MPDWSKDGFMRVLQRGIELFARFNHNIHMDGRTQMIDHHEFDDKKIIVMDIPSVSEAEIFYDSAKSCQRSGFCKI